MPETKISFLDVTWNPVVGGCSPRSDGCANCWATALHEMRHKAFLAGKKVPPQYAKPWSELQLLADRLEQPLHWKKPRRIGVCFGTDLFLDAVPIRFLHDVVGGAIRAYWHQFLFLTKRPARMTAVFSEYKILGPYRHCWLGVSLCNQADADKHLPHLQRLAEAGWKTWISLEPLLGATDIAAYCQFIRFCAAGGETGRNACPCHPDWLRAARDACMAAVPFHTPGEVSFHLKSRGEFLPWDECPVQLRRCPIVECDGITYVRVGRRRAGRILDGRTHDDLPGVVVGNL